MTSPDPDEREQVTIVTCIDHDELAWRMMRAAGIDVPGVVSLSDDITGKDALKAIEDDNPTRAWRWRKMAGAAVLYILDQINGAEIKQVH